MGNSYGDPQQNRNYEGNRDNYRGGMRGGRGQGNRGPGGREGGGFRIRLSDNEMRASRSLQEAFNLRSTVAVLGFAIRTLAQMLEEGKLDGLVAEIRANTSQGSSRRNEGNQGARRNSFDGERQDLNRSGPKANPFARPEKPQPSATDGNEAEQNQSEENQSTIQNDNSGSEVEAIDHSSPVESTGQVEGTNEVDKNNSTNSSQS